MATDGDRCQYEEPYDLSVLAKEEDRIYEVEYEEQPDALELEPVPKTPPTLDEPATVES